MILHFLHFIWLYTCSRIVFLIKTEARDYQLKLNFSSLLILREFVFAHEFDEIFSYKSITIRFFKCIINSELRNVFFSYLYNSITLCLILYYLFQFFAHKKVLASYCWNLSGQTKIAINDLNFLSFDLLRKSLHGKMHVKMYQMFCYKSSIMLRPVVYRLDILLIINELK